MDTNGIFLTVTEVNQIKSQIKSNHFQNQSFQQIKSQIKSLPKASDLHQADNLFSRPKTFIFGLVFGYPDSVSTSVVLWSLAALIFCGGLSSGRGFVFGLALKLCSPRQLAGWSTWSAISDHVQGGPRTGRDLWVLPEGSYSPIENGDNLYAGILLGISVATVVSQGSFIAGLERDSVGAGNKKSQLAQVHARILPQLPLVGARARHAPPQLFQRHGAPLFPTRLGRRLCHL